jgi:hypothetical protein
MLIKYIWILIRTYVARQAYVLVEKRTKLVQKESCLIFVLEVYRQIYRGEMIFRLKVFVVSSGVGRVPASSAAQEDTGYQTAPKHIEY